MYHRGRGSRPQNYKEFGHAVCKADNCSFNLLFGDGLTAIYVVVKLVPRVFSLPRLERGPWERSCLVGWSSLQ